MGVLAVLVLLVVSFSQDNNEAINGIKTISYFLILIINKLKIAIRKFGSLRENY